MKRILALVVAVLPSFAGAQTPLEMTESILSEHILPRYAVLAEASAALEDVAAEACTADAPELRAAYGVAFDNWVGVSHLRFGPSEVEDRAFALAFWPDSRGATPRVLRDLILQDDPIVADVEGYREVSIAGRGFYALEFLLYDPEFAEIGEAAQRCQLIQTIIGDIAGVTAELSADWAGRYAAVMITPGEGATYQSDLEVVQELFGALSTGLQFTSETRFGRPLGTFEQPRPNRAEVWRSGRSVRHVELSLAALRDLALRLALNDPEVGIAIKIAFANSTGLLDELEDPILASVAEPQGRLRVEVVQQSIDAIREIVRDELGPMLSVAAGFNALDGD